MQNHYPRPHEKPERSSGDASIRSEPVGAGDAHTDKSPISMIGADIVITGNIEASVDLHIEGRVNGDVRCATLILGGNSSVNGSIHAERVRVSGMVEGAIDTRDLAIEAGALVTGDIIYERLRIANGGCVEGTMKRKAPVEDEGSKLKLVEPQGQSRQQQEVIVIE